MSSGIIINLFYIASATLFILGIKKLGKAETAGQGNRVSAIGMLIAVVVTLLDSEIFSYLWIIAGIGIGSVIGVFWAKSVKMTGMPELVALFNSFGGLASLLVGWAEYDKIVNSQKFDTWAKYFEFTNGNASFSATVIFAAIFIGGITFSGSVYAWGKLSGKLGGAALTYPGQKEINGLFLAICLLTGLIFIVVKDGDFANGIFFTSMVLSLLLGILIVMPIGGGDMPVVISLLNAFSGIAAAAAGFVILNNVLIVAGCLVGASGLILTIIMCKAMNRSLGNVLFSGFGASAQKGGSGIEGEMKAASVQDAYFVLEAAQSVVIIPGYGMAVAQAQHAVKELADLLSENGTEVKYAVHPVAGRMPGHMNVLLAEADVPYEQLVEMDDVNPLMPNTDVAIVIGANDVVNPAALDEPGCPIFGMPIIRAHEAKTVYALKRGKGAGFSGLINKLYFSDKTRMLYGDAKETLTNLVTEFKSG